MPVDVIAIAIAVTDMTEVLVAARASYFAMEMTSLVNRITKRDASWHCWPTSLMVKSLDTYGRHCCALRFILPAD